MFIRRSYQILAAAVLGLAAAHAFAGDFFAEKGSALDGYDVLSYYEGSADPMPGSAELSFVYLGTPFYFATHGHLAKFSADPKHYAPQFGGYDAYALSQGQKIGGHPRVFAVVDGKLYFFHDFESRKNWKKDISGTLARASDRWSDITRLASQNK